MVKVICDTSFLMHIANTRIKNIANIETEIGQLDYFVPDIVLQELETLSNDKKKGANAKSTLTHIQNFSKIELVGTYADTAILDYIKKYGGMVATMDKELKNKIKNLGGSVISVANDRIILEQ